MKSFTDAESSATNASPTLLPSTLCFQLPSLCLSHYHLLCLSTRPIPAAHINIRETSWTFFPLFYLGIIVFWIQVWKALWSRLYWSQNLQCLNSSAVYPNYGRFHWNLCSSPGYILHYNQYPMLSAFLLERFLFGQRLCWLSAVQFGKVDYVGLLEMLTVCSKGCWYMALYFFFCFV